MPQTPQPSIQADSSSSRGISFMNPVQTKMAMARENAAYGMISAQYVLSIDELLKLGLITISDEYIKITPDNFGVTSAITLKLI